MKKIISLFILLTVIPLNTAFSKERAMQDSVVLFSDTDFDVPHIYHTIEVLGFIVGSDSIAYSIVKIREYPSKKISYKLFVAKGNVSRSFEFSELHGMEYLILGKMGFDDNGTLNIPILTQKSGIHLHMYKAYLDKLEYIENGFSKKSMNLIGAMYDSNILFVNDRLGRISFIEGNQEIKTIEGIKVESIKDVRRQGDDIFFVVTSRNKNSLDVNLIHSKVKDYKQHSTTKLEISKENVNSNFKIEFLSRGKLIISKNPRATPALNPSSALILLNLDTKEIDYKFSEETAESVIDIGIACSGETLIPIAVYAFDNGVTDDLIIKYNGKEKLLKPAKKGLFSIIKTQTINGETFILSNYKYLIGRTIYSELSLMSVGVDRYEACTGLSFEDNN